VGKRGKALEEGVVTTLYRNTPCEDHRRNLASSDFERGPEKEEQMKGKVITKVTNDKQGRIVGKVFIL